jgi:sigma-E factor negative regulatory protein RseA
MMKQNISALMDGELFEDEADSVLDRLKKSSDLQQTWQSYHLIGDALRQPDYLAKDFSARFHERLEAEPIVFAPRRRVMQKARYFALSAAASVMALALVAWLSMQVGTERTPQLAVAPQAVDIHPASFSNNTEINDYVMAHQEFSPTTDVHGAASYIHTVHK